MPWWGWTVLGATLGVGLDLLVQWGRVRLGARPGPYVLAPCRVCGTPVPTATWRCYACRSWLRRPIARGILSVLQVPAFVGGFVLLLVALVLFGIFWAFLLIVGPVLRLGPMRPVVRGTRRIWRALFGPPGSWRGVRERRAYWWRGGRLVEHYLIPLGAGSPGAMAGDILENAIGGRDVPGAWRGAVVWLREPDAVISSSFLAGTHLTEVGATHTWVDRGTFHRVELAPIREWVGWRGTRQDLEALGDLYMSIAGGSGLVAVGTGADRAPPLWGPATGEAPVAWIRLDTTHGGTGWDVDLHWELWYDPESVPSEVLIRSDRR